ncbi:hypothetical protein THAOC_02867, partial [Thalassiosira oceanica]
MISRDSAWEDNYVRTTSLRFAPASATRIISIPCTEKSQSRRGFRGLIGNPWKSMEWTQSGSTQVQKRQRRRKEGKLRAIGVAIVRGNAQHKLSRLHYVRATPEEAADACSANHSSNRWNSQRHGQSNWFSQHTPDGQWKDSMNTQWKDSMNT